MGSIHQMQFPIDMENIPQGMRKVFIDIAHPVGSYYWSNDQTSPDELFPDTEWERIAGRFLYAANDTHPVNSLGGSEYVTLDTENVPPLSVTLNMEGQHGVHGQMTDMPVVTYAGHGDGTWFPSGSAGSANPTPVNNMPPYIAAYCWKRTG